MALTEIEQLQKVFETSKYILVLFNSDDTGDGLGSALALKIFLEKQHKQVDAVSNQFVVPKSLKFLSGAEQVKPELAHLQKFIIKVDVSKSDIETISYDVKDNWLSIYLTPKHGTISREELRTAQSAFKYDLIITLSVPDLASLGHIFANNTDLFYKTSVVNIDHRPNNEHYGQIKIIDLNASSTSEIVYKIIKQASPNHLDQNTATALYAGMTMATQSFKNPHLTPNTMQIAGALVEAGAEREKIVQNIYRTRSVATLKLWGEALTHLQNDRELGLVHTIITRDDFVRSGGKSADLPGIADELISSAPEAKIFLMLFESDDATDKKIGGIITAEKNYDALNLVKPFSPRGDKHRAWFALEGRTLREAEEMVIKNIKEILRA